MRSIAALILATVLLASAAPTLAQPSTLEDLCLRVLAPQGIDLSDPAFVQAQIASGDTSVVEVVPCLSRSDDPLSEFIVEYRAGGWFASVISEDPETGKLSAYAALTAEHGTSPSGEPISLVIRCRDGEVKLFVAWFELLGGTTVLSQVGTGPVEEARWNHSEDNDSSFYPEERVRSFIESMFGETRFVARANLVDSGLKTAIFDIEGIASATRNIRKACDWQARSGD